MKLEEAFTQAIKKYFEGLEAKEYKKAVGSRKHKYTKEYFDAHARELGLMDDEEVVPNENEVEEDYDLDDA